jgi:cellulose synthase/poly-beta-1,6-N-acetylglucosamine synthase-like glycosyltransferase
VLIVIAIAAALVVLLALVSLSAVAQLRRFSRHAAPDDAAPATLPPTTLVIPCKGDDGTLVENLTSVVDQDHPDIEFVLVTATEHDPAQVAFARLREAFPGKRIKTVVAGVPDHCSQQNNNQVAGIAASDPRSEVIVIMDSDGQADKRFVAKLVAPRVDAKVGATSGYRWYAPRWGSLPDVLRTAWNAGGYVFLVNPRTRFVWGGAMAFRRSTYDQANIAGVWLRALSDDHTLSHWVKKQGLSLVFVPQCIVISRAPDTLRSVVEWTNRQTLVTRFYNPAFWITAAVFHVLGNVLGWGLLIGGVLHLVVRGPEAIGWVALAGGAAWVGHLWLYGLLMVGPLNRLLEPHGVRLGARRWLLVLVAPLASLLQGLNSVNSCLTRRIRWAGITYHINGPERMHVV